MKQFCSFIALLFSSVLVAQAPSIPIIHLEDYVNPAKKQQFLLSFEEAVQEVGYFYVDGFPVESKSINRAYEQAKIFFASDEKLNYLSPNGHRGYLPGESAKGETRVDFKEFYHIGRELPSEDLERLQYEKNVWPENSKEFRFAMEPLFARIDLFKNKLGEAFSELLDQKKGLLLDMIQEGDSLMRISHYPANPPENAIWAGTHTDINLFTLYPSASAQGLQVQAKDGSWIDINIPQGMMFVHCGDMLENLSNGLCKAAVHRVVDNGLSEDRYAIVFFVHPRTDDRLDPLPSCVEKTGGMRHYANLSRAELLTERLIDLGVANEQMMELFVRSGAIQKLKEVNRFSPKAETALKKAGFITPQLELQ
ncbi:isopenicillin N synthase family dioxygenase [Simkania sp.]|uniref:isopenicillin N synthase family dioxygenase n=1 Tax=Simkania sp. TaxID=34094 RepID=UPI003B51CE7E